MTHLAVADDDGKQDFTDKQLEKFEVAVKAFREQGFSPNLVHAANSAATFAHARNSENLVRPGGTLYGFAADVLPGEYRRAAIAAGDVALFPHHAA
jgi:alanine racemase